MNIIKVEITVVKKTDGTFDYSVYYENNDERGGSSADSVTNAIEQVKELIDDFLTETETDQIYPTNDPDFEDTLIESVGETTEQGSSITRSDGFSFFVPATEGIVPKIGDKVRFYGKGIGHVVRGLFINGVKLFYRTYIEQKEADAIELYGANAEDWLARWDAGRSVWSISMGGFGPGYEQALQVTAVELLRELISSKPDASKWTDSDEWRACRDNLEVVIEREPVKSLGVSGAQWGAAITLAAHLYAEGPAKLMAVNVEKARHIQIQKNFPQG